MSEGGLQMLKSVKFSTLVLLIWVLLMAGAQANTYVSLNGNFYINYPDDWEQIDYVTVDAFLSRGGAEESMYNYDAVLAPSSSSPFFDTDYLIITLETVGELAEYQIDSILGEFKQDYSRGITYLPFNTMLADIKTSRPAYDTVSQTLSLLNDIYQGQDALKKNLIVMKFYEQGIATFYFFSPDTTFEDSKKTFEDIMASFSTENVKDALPRQSVKVADIDTDEEGRLRESGSKVTFYLSIAILILLIIVIFVRMKRKRS